MKMTRPTKIAFLITALILLIWAAAYPVSKALSPDMFKEPFGPVYNGLSVLFSALAFGGMVTAILFQVEEARIARRESIERSIFELFQTFTSLDFQKVKDASFRALLAGVKDRDYAKYLASRLFVVNQLPFPTDAKAVLAELDESKRDLDDAQIIQADRADRLMLDNALNFFAMLAQRESSATVIKHCDFAYDWWRPVLWLIGQLQREWYESNESVRKYCKNQLIIVTLESLDKIYGHEPLRSHADVWDYITQHPKLLAFGLDKRYRQRLAATSLTVTAPS